MTFRELSRHRWFVAAAGVSLLVFAAFVTDGTGRFNHAESFGSFYDYQAQSLLHGRWDVPVQAIGQEAFVVGGKFYGYFGITPAILRMPFVLLGLGFGRLSRALMCFDDAICLLFAYLLLIEATRLARGADARPSRLATLVLILNTGLGSTLLFLGTRAFTYHEAVLAGAAFALAGSYGALRYLDEPRRAWWLFALVATFFSVHARASVGLFPLAFTAGVAAWHALAALRSGQPKNSLRHGVVLGLGGLIAFSLYAVSYLKFKVWEAEPLRYNTLFTPARLAHIGGKAFHLGNLGFNVSTYLLHPGLALRGSFPWIYVHPPDGTTFPEARIDYAEKTLALPFAMPALFILAVAGSLCAFASSRKLRPALILAWLAALPVAAILLTVAFEAQRYTGDFCPFLIAAAALALAAGDGPALPWRPLWAWGLGGLTVASVVITLALSWNFQAREVVGFPPTSRKAYQLAGQRIDDFFWAVGHRGQWPDGQNLRQIKIRSHLAGFSCQAFMAGPQDDLTAGFILNADNPKDVRLRVSGLHWRLFYGPGLIGEETPRDRGGLESTLQQGPYTLVISGAAPGGPAASGELIDTNPEGEGRDQFLANVSTRGRTAGTGQPLRLTFTISGEGEKELLIRGMGPSLTKAGLQGCLADPLLQVWNGRTRLASNAGLEGDAALARQVSIASDQVGAWPLAVRDAALVLRLSPGTYSITLTSSAGRPGAGLIDLFDTSTHF